LQASFQRSNSHDKVRKIVAEEGRAARNLIAWSVPLESKEEEGQCFASQIYVSALRGHLNTFFHEIIHTRSHSVHSVFPLAPLPHSFSAVLSVCCFLPVFSPFIASDCDGYNYSPLSPQNE
uniref:Uncharacterized protein n=1 Tax=Hippocampus comes TaxID=109280 RepID=A0A3Q2XWF2_HIPCM